MNSKQNSTQKSNQSNELTAIMNDVNSRLAKLKNSSDLDDIIKDLLPKIAGESIISNQLKKFLNKK
jgi:hypothetical protein